MVPDQPIDILIKSFIVKDIKFKKKGLDHKEKIIKSHMIGINLINVMLNQFKEKIFL